MITFRRQENLIIATYISYQNNSTDWIYEAFENDDSVTFNRVYNFTSKEILTKQRKEPKILSILDFEYPPIDFRFAELEGDYFKIIKGVLATKFDIYIHLSIDFEKELFIAESNLSIFKKIEPLVNEDIFIGGENPTAISELEYLAILEHFPNEYEKRLYAEARIASVIKEFFATTKQAEKKFEKYINKKITSKGENLLKTFQNTELIKYQTILEKLQKMLVGEISYSENQWQDEILQIILLLYPKYFLVFKEAPIRSAYDKENVIREKFIDILLVDSNGNIDVIEIKKPSKPSLMTVGQFRNNHIPLRELSGTVMQIEKYIFYLNRWGENGEKYLTGKYQDQLPKKFDIKITNPKGFIIMGRENDLNLEQIKDFEVIKRKYKNVVDIITYDDLLRRLKFTIEQIKLL